MVKNGRTYQYEVRSYRDNGKVKEESRYLVAFVHEIIYPNIR